MVVSWYANVTMPRLRIWFHCTFAMALRYNDSMTRHSVNVTIVWLTQKKNSFNNTVHFKSHIIQIASPQLNISGPYVHHFCGALTCLSFSWKLFSFVFFWRFFFLVLVFSLFCVLLFRSVFSRVFSLAFAFCRFFWLYFAFSRFCLIFSRFSYRFLTFSLFFSLFPAFSGFFSLFPHFSLSFSTLSSLFPLSSVFPKHSIPSSFKCITTSFRSVPLFG